MKLKNHMYLDLLGLPHPQWFSKGDLNLPNMEGGIETHHLQQLVVHPREMCIKEGGRDVGKNYGCELMNRVIERLSQFTVH